MKHLVFSTADVSAREQFAFWRDGFAEAVLGVGGEPLAATDRGFRARAEAWIAPSLQRFAYSVDNELVSRGRHEIERRPWDSFWIYHERGPGRAASRIPRLIAAGDDRAAAGPAGSGC